MKMNESKKKVSTYLIITFAITYTFWCGLALLTNLNIVNAQRFEDTFYQQQNPAETSVEPKNGTNGITDEVMLNYMLSNPQFIEKFKVLLGIGNN